MITDLLLGGMIGLLAASVLLLAQHSIAAWAYDRRAQPIVPRSLFRSDVRRSRASLPTGGARTNVCGNCGRPASPTANHCIRCGNRLKP